MGGATLSKPPENETEQLEIAGSAIIARAPSAEEVLKVLRQDVYYRTGVWDWDKLQIYPVRIFLKRGHLEVER